MRQTLRQALRMLARDWRAGEVRVLAQFAFGTTAA